MMCLAAHVGQVASALLTHWRICLIKRQIFLSDYGRIVNNWQEQSSEANRMEKRGARRWTAIGIKKNDQRRQKQQLLGCVHLCCEIGALDACDQLTTEPALHNLAFRHK